MSSLLFVVEDSFVLPFGLVLVPGVPESGPVVQVGDEVELRRPDATTSLATVKSIPLVCGPARRRGVFLDLGTQLSKQDVPLGTEVWLRRGG
jgi:hypothetical protein